MLGVLWHHDNSKTVQVAVAPTTPWMADAVQPGVGCARDVREASLNSLTANQITPEGVFPYMIRKLKSGGYRLYSRKKDPKTGKRRNLGTFSSRAAAEKHEQAVQYFKRA